MFRVKKHKTPPKCSMVETNYQQIFTDLIKTKTFDLKRNKII